MTQPIPPALIKTASDARAAADGCYYDEQAAERVVQFYAKFLRVPKGRYAGKPMHLLPWQADDVIRPLFGWKRPDGSRRFREAFVTLAKKNGKTNLVGGLPAYAMLADGEQAAEVYSAAADKEQAGIAYKDCVDMIKASPELSSRIALQESVKRMHAPGSNALYRVLAADGFRTDGINAHLILFDELHTQRDRRLYDALRYAGAARRQPLRVEITTAGEWVDSLCGERWAYAERILRGEVIDVETLPVIFAPPKGADFEKPEVWRMGNPSLGTVLSEEEFARDLAKAKAEGPAAWRSFLRYRLNVWPTAATTESWFEAEAWDACKMAFDEADLERTRCWVGLDCGRTSDFSAACFLFETGDGLRAFWRYWVAEATLHNRTLTQKLPLDAWAAEGHITITPGNVTDYDRIEHDIAEMAQRFDMQAVAYDPKFARELSQRLQDNHGLQVFEFIQTAMNYNEPVMEIERAVLSQRLVHNGDPVTAHMARSVVKRTSPASGLSRPDKPAVGAAHVKIDGIVALLMAQGARQGKAGTQAPMPNVWAGWKT
jgi:phage terminase large subunit-like protein